MLGTCNGVLLQHSGVEGCEPPRASAPLPHTALPPNSRARLASSLHCCTPPCVPPACPPPVPLTRVHHVAGRAVRLGHPLCKLAGVGDGGREEGEAHGLGGQDDAFLPHHAALLVPAAAATAAVEASRSRHGGWSVAGGAGNLSRGAVDWLAAAQPTRVVEVHRERPSASPQGDPSPPSPACFLPPRFLTAGSAPRRTRPGPAASRLPSRGTAWTAGSRWS